MASTESNHHTGTGPSNVGRRLLIVILTAILFVKATGLRTCRTTQPAYQSTTASISWALN